MGNWRHRAERIRGFLAAPTDGASLALFRICFGLVIAWEAVRYLWPSGGINRVQRYFVEPACHLTYPGFGWVHPWPEPFMTAHIVLLGLAGLALAFGLCYRFAAVAVTLLFSYVFLLDESLYLNHFYLMCLLAFLLIGMPADACFSLGRRLRRRGTTESATIPFWPVFLLRSQIFILYFYGGLAKLNADWLSGAAMYEPAQQIVHFLTGATGSDGDASLLLFIAKFLAIGGTIFDLSIGFLLLWRRTRLLGLVWAGMFHAINSQLFPIGVFPVLAFTATLIFCEPDWPRRAVSWLRRGDTAKRKQNHGLPELPGSPIPLAPRPVFAFVVLWLAVQLLVPLRHYAIAGNTNWCEEGEWFSWRMMGHAKVGQVQFSIVDPALWSADTAGHTRFNWNEWSRQNRPVVYAPVDAVNADAASLPELFVVCEPLLGERIIYKPSAGILLQSRLESEWKGSYGRSPTVTPTVSLADALAAIDREVGAAGDKEFTAALHEVASLAAANPSTIRDWEAHTASWHKPLQQLLADPARGAMVRRHLALVHPLVLQGRLHQGSPWYVIEDPAMVSADAAGFARVDQAQWKGQLRLFADLGRFGHSDWASLPQVLVIDSGLYPYVLWNQHRDLIDCQARLVEQIPTVMHQYAQRIAGQWAATFGRRPAVHVTSSLLAMNHQPAQTIIDSRIDLASAPLRLFRHNDWILPLRDQPIPLEPTGGKALWDERSGFERVTKRFANGQPESAERTVWRDGESVLIVRSWYENGLPCMYREYLDGRPHGTLLSWHPNGTLAKEAHYQHGRLQGPAAMYYPSGGKSWEGTFESGYLHGRAVCWSGNGQLEGQDQFSLGSRLPGGQRTDALGSAVMQAHYERVDTEH